MSLKFYILIVITLFISTGLNAQWETLTNKGIPDSVTLNGVYPHENNLFLATDDGIFLFDQANNTWNRFGDSLRNKNIPGNNHMTFTARQNIFAGTDKKLYRYENNEDYWQLMKDTSIGNDYQFVKAYQYQNDTAVFAGDWGNGIYRSRDGGKTWDHYTYAPVSDGGDTGTTTYVDGLALNWGSRTIAYGFDYSETNGWIFTMSKDVIQISKDGGNNWFWTRGNFMSRNVDNPSGVLVREYRGEEYLFKATNGDNSGTWTLGRTVVDDSVALNWDPIWEGWNSPAKSDFLVNYNEGVFFDVTNSGQVYVLFENGDEYRTMNNTPGNMNSMNVMGDTIYAVTSSQDSVYTYYPGYNATLTVKRSADSSAIQGAEVILGSDTVNTDADGKTVFNNMTNIEYQIRKDGYWTALGHVAFGKDSINQTIYLDTVYDVTCTVKSKVDSAPIKNAEVILNGKTDTTSSTGQITFPETHATLVNYAVRKENYNGLSGTLNVDHTIDTTFYLDTLYNVNFTIKNTYDSAIMSHTSVDLNGNSKSTSEDGKVIYSDLLPADSVPYVTEKSGFYDTSGVIDINKDVDTTLYMRPKRYDIALTILNKATSQPLSDAEVIVGTDTIMTPDSGKVSFTDIPAALGFDYTIRKSGYQEISGTLSAASDINRTESLRPTYTVDITVKSKTDSGLIQGAEIVLGSDTSYTPDSGKVIVEDVLYDAGYMISHDNYLNIADNFRLGGNLDTTFYLDTVYDVAFTVKSAVDSMPVSNAELTLGTQTVTTPDSGKVHFQMPPADSIHYSISKTGYMENTGNIDIDGSLNTTIYLDTVFTVTFTIENADDSTSIEGANVLFSNDTIETNANGKATFTNIGFNQNMPYQIMDSNYYNISGELDVVKDIDTILRVQKTGIQNITASSHIELYPNPVQSDVRLKFDAPVQGNIDIRIMNMKGATMKVFAFSKNRPVITRTINVSDLDQGIYFIQISTANKSFLQKILIK